MESRPIIKIHGVETRFGNVEVHRGISFAVETGEIIALIGGSGCGKTTLLKELLDLQRPTAGIISLFGVDIHQASILERQRIRDRCGVLFQYSALFSGLNAGENIALPLREHTRLSNPQIKRLVQLRLSLVGLAPETAHQMPSELSGGMRKRVGLARALALEPELLFLDEPTSGLDPIGARAFDRLILTLRDSLNLTVFMVTHDLDSILAIADRVVVLEAGRVLADGTPVEVQRIEHPWIREYFSARSRGT